MIELNVFTNSRDNFPASTEHIERTISSFKHTFETIPMQIWFDPNPNIKKASKYKKRLQTLYDCPIIETTSLSDGYVKAVTTSKSPYLFMLEHDWEFVPPIDSLANLISLMNQYKITHLRFNKRKNEVAGSDRDVRDIDGKFCLTSWVSNNPHIIHRKRWIREALPFVEISKGSRGIEHRLKNKGITAAIYGPQGQEVKVIHLDP
jgi:hypothetical protein